MKMTMLAATLVLASCLVAPAIAGVPQGHGPVPTLETPPAPGIERIDTQGPASWRYNVALLALADGGGEGPAETAEYTGGGGGWNWHRIFGYSTVVTGLATIVTGFVAPESVHWGFAVASTSFGIVTCANGFYQYHSVLGFGNGSAQYTVHAILGSVATAGFIASLALADHEGEGSHRHHAITGTASGISFAVAIGICYF